MQPAMAEYGWALSEKTQTKAREELNECPESCSLAVDAVREQIETRPDIDFLCMDTSFILRFLRARKFDHFESFKLYARYFEYRQKNLNLFKKFYATEPCIKTALCDGFPCVLPDKDSCGRTVLVLFTANWDMHAYGLGSIYRALLLSLEKLITSEEVQVNGFVIIVDWSEFTFKQSTWIQPHILKLMIEGLQDCFPARFTAIHFVNQPWYIEAIFKVMKPFLKEKTKQKIHMIGNNLALLYAHVQREVLPAELGGDGPPYHMQSWAHQLIGKDENFSFGEKQIYWPDHSCGIKTRSETFPLDNYTTEVKTEKKQSTQLDEEFFLID
ncbi:Clavesin-2 [Lamellibrachia satsuma]|nr:Clavesin-2 [Lamellibrachia satsuma]